MPLLRPRPKAGRKRSRLRAYTVLRCPLNGHQVSFCRGLCAPVDGRGICGRAAAHSMMGRHQAAIAMYEARKRR